MPTSTTCPPLTPRPVGGTFATEVERAGAVVAGHSLDETFLSRQQVKMTLRWAYVHMIQEYARHNGHADLIRERIDGMRGD